MRPDPGHKLLPRELTCSESQHRAFAFLYIGVKFESVQHQKRFHCCMAYALVTVDERMIHGKRKAERRRFCFQIGVQIFPFKGHSRLGDSRLQRLEITNPGRPAGPFDYPNMNLEYFGKRQESHLAQASVKFLILVQDQIRCRLKIGFCSRQKIRDRGCHELLGSQLEPPGDLIQLFSLAIVNLNQNLHISLDSNIIACSSSVPVRKVLSVPQMIPHHAANQLALGILFGMGCRFPVRRHKVGRPQRVAFAEHGGIHDGCGDGLRLEPEHPFRG